MSIAGAIGSVIGAGIDAWSSQSNAKRNIKLQKEFAKTGIQWKAEDARKAGIHPLYALGAQTHSFSPVSVGSDFGTAFANAGQDLSRAMHATRTEDQRQDAYSKTLQDLQVQKFGLENESLKMDIASKAARLAQQSTPAMPSAGMPTVGPSDVDKPINGRVPFNFLGRQFYYDTNSTSKAQDLEDITGDVPSGIMAGAETARSLVEGSPMFLYGRGLAAFLRDRWLHGR